MLPDEGLDIPELSSAIEFPEWYGVVAGYAGVKKLSFKTARQTMMSLHKEHAHPNKELQSLSEEELKRYFFSFPLCMVSLQA